MQHYAGSDVGHTLTKSPQCRGSMHYANDGHALHITRLFRRLDCCRTLLWTGGGSGFWRWFVVGKEGGWFWLVVVGRKVGKDWRETSSTLKLGN